MGGIRYPPPLGNRVKLCRAWYISAAGCVLFIVIFEVLFVTNILVKNILYENTLKPSTWDFILWQPISPYLETLSYYDNSIKTSIQRKNWDFLVLSSVQDDGNNDERMRIMMRMIETSLWLKFIFINIYIIYILIISSLFTSYFLVWLSPL